MFQLYMQHTLKLRWKEGRINSLVWASDKFPSWPPVPACSLVRRRKAPEAAAAAGLKQRSGPYRIVPRRLFVLLDARPGRWRTRA